MTFSIKKKTLKKIVSSLTMFATVVSMSGMMAFSTVVAAEAIADGALIKSDATNPDGTPTMESLDVYIVKTVGEKMFKRLILNPTVFESYGHLSWGDIQTVSETVMGTYTTSSLVRVDTDPDEKVYAMAPDGDIGSKSWVNLTTEEATSVTGYDADSVYTINSTDGGNYNTVGDVTTPAELTTFYSAGTLPEGPAPVPVDGDLAISLSANTPASATQPASAQAVPFTTVLLTAGDADVSVTGMTVERTGLGASTDISKIYVMAGGTIRGSLKSLPTSDEAFLLFSTGANPIIITAGTTEEVTVYANMNAGTAGHANALSITALTTDAGTVVGLPVTGNQMVVGAVSAPTATMAQVSISTTRNIGDADIDVAKVKITNTNSNEDVSVNAITFKSIAPASGTKIDSDDVADFELYEGTTIVSNTAQVDASGFVVVTLDTPAVILKGGSKYKTFTLKADIVDGPGRIITMDISRAIDLNATGNTNGFRTTNTDSYTPIEVTIANSDLAVSLDSVNTPKTQTVLNDQTITLLKGKLVAGKGAVTATGMTVTLNGNDMDFGTTDEYENLKVYIDDVLVSSATGSTLGTADDQTTKAVAFTDEFPVNGTSTVEVTIDVKSVTDTDWIQAVIAGSNITATRDSDDASITPTGTATGNKQTIGAATLAVTLAAVPTSATRVKGSTDVEFLGFNLVAGANDAVKVTDISLVLDATGGTEDSADISNVRIYASNGTTLVAGPVNLDSSFKAVFTGLEINLAKGTSTKYITKADVNTTINDSSITAINLEYSDITAEDSQGDDIASITGGNTSQINTSATVNLTVVDRGTLDVELATTTPKTHQVLANSTGDETTEVKFTAGYEDVIIKKVILTAAAGAGADDEVKKVAIMDGATELASTQSIVTGVATLIIPEDKWVTVPADGTKNLTVVTDYYSTSNSVADTGAVVQWTILSFATDIEADGAVKDVFGTVKSTTGTGISVATASAATAAINLGAGITATQTTIPYDTLVNTFTAGNVIVVGTEYMLITEVNSTILLTVRRGIGGTTAATAADDAVITGYTQKLSGESAIVYSNFPAISASSQPTGTLVVGEYDVFKFTLTEKDLGEEPLRLEELTLRVDLNGAGACVGDFCISDIKLFNGSNQVGSTLTTDVITSGDVTFSTLDADADSIVTGATTFTVKATVASGAAFTAGDSMKFSINDFGSANAAGTITAGDIDWEDDENGASQIEWIDTTSTSVDGNTFSFSS